jgi:signal transduction histidine kinase/ActR/RegA family two-component response regulator
MIFRGRAHPLKWHLYLLIAGSILPMTVFAALLVWRTSTAERSKSRQRLERVAQSLAWTMEREVASTTRTLQALAESELLDNNRLRQFHERARRVAHTQPTWYTVILLTPDGRQLINTMRPFGSTLPRVNEPASLQKVLATHRPVVGTLAKGQQSGQWAFPIRVPVMRGGKVRYVLTAVLTPQAIQNLLVSQGSTPEEWARGIVDSNGLIVVRTRDPQNFVGKKARASSLRRMAESPEGFFRNVTLDGRDVYVAYRRIGDTGWTASISVPVEVLDAPGRSALATVIAIGAITLVLSGLGALHLSRRIARAIASSADGAKVLARGEKPIIEHFSIVEIEALRNALQSASELLEARGRERDQLLARTEAARDEAEEASHLKDVFLATVSHELRTPLTAILGWASLLRSDQLDESMRESSLGIIERSARSLSALVQDLLDTSRIISGKMVIDTVPTNFNEAVMSAVDQLMPAAESKGVKLIAETRDLFVLGDAQRLQQVASNLLSNAIKFTPAGGRVEVGLRAHDGYAELRVSDSGIGIKPEFLPYVFERFRQADGSNTREHGGLGLGLAIARQLVELQGGTIQVESEGDGTGATFIVRLPLIGSSHGDAVEPFGVGAIESNKEKHHLQSTLLRGISILVVDDEQEVRDLIAAALRLHGAEVHVSPSASEAFAKFVELQPSFLLSDIAMPHQDGYTLIRRIREWERPRGQTVPAAALTALAGDDARVQAFDAGFQAHIAKPIETEELCQTVIRLLRPHHNSA